ncbi:DUF6153 family protein [Streptomyces sp. NPDC020742]|uniref:DUF6153 family protein n=1 Tax=Streptomyces sp. NPDC020742 TaxID=3154897 RepID=UPI00340042E8
MSIRRHTSPPQPRLRPKVLLVLTVLAGLLGMHGVGNASPLPSAHPTTHSAHQLGTAGPEGCHGIPAARGEAKSHTKGHTTGHAAAPSKGHGGRLGDGHGDSPGGGHGSHADPTCASGAIPGSPASPVLAASLTGQADTVARPTGRAAPEAAGARAPPTLAQLQILRI